MRVMVSSYIYEDMDSLTLWLWIYSAKTSKSQDSYTIWMEFEWGSFLIADWFKFILYVFILNLFFPLKKPVTFLVV